MKFAAIALVAAAFTASAASASDRATDVDFLRANRCKGLAASLTGVVDSAALDAYVKAEGRSRSPYVIERAGNEFDRAKRDAKMESRKPALTSELTGSCQAYLGPASSVAKQ